MTPNSGGDVAVPTVATASTFGVQRPPSGTAQREVAVDGQDLRKFGKQLVAGGGAGAVAKTATAPLERIKVLFQVQELSKVPESQKLGSLREALVRIPREQGVLSLWRGNGANVARIIPNSAIRFTMFDRFKEWTMPADGVSTVTHKFASGALSGATTLICTYPIDLVRTRLAADTAALNDARHYTGIWDCMRTTVRNEGVGGLFKGMSMGVFGMMCYMGISFAIYDSVKSSRLLASPRAKESWWYPMVKLAGGGAAGLVAQTLLYPIDTVRRRIQMNGGVGYELRYGGVRHCVRTMLRTEGVAAFYRGVAVNALKTTPGAAIQFVAYDLLKSRFTDEAF